MANEPTITRFEVKFLIKWKINALTLIVWALSSIFLLLVQFGYISSIGIIVVTPAQYVWIFWISAIAFIATTINLVARVQRHARWSIGFSGEIVRTVRIAGQDMEYFVRGKSDSRIKEVLLNNWTFIEHDYNSKWYVTDEHGNDITDRSFSSINGTASVVIEANDR